MKQKTYPEEITEEILSIGQAMKKVFDSQKSNLRLIAKFSAMSVNSVKAVLTGKTANIASYALVAKALGTSLVDVVAASTDVEPTTTLAVPKEEPEKEQDPTDQLLIQ